MPFEYARLDSSYLRHCSMAHARARALPAALEVGRRLGLGAPYRHSLASTPLTFAPYPQRVQPFGYDSASNEYYFLDDNRVWIHRSPPTNRSKLRSNRRATAGPAKGKGKGKAKAVAPRITPKSKAAPAPTTTSRKREAPTTPTSTTRKTKRARRGSVGDEGDDGWEPIPKELMEEWSRSQDDGKNGDKTTGGGGGDGESSTGSALTSLDGASDESKAEVEAESDLSELSELSSEEREDDDDDPDSDANDDGEDTEAQTEMELEELGEDGLLSWERDFWAERKRIEALPNFIEWEAVSRFVYSEMLKA